MSNKRKQPKAKKRKVQRARLTLSGPQNTRLQQALQAQSQGNAAFAESTYRALIAEKVRVPQPYSNLALICAQSDRHEEAHRLWRMALSIDPDSLEAALGRAGHFERMDRVKEAMEAYKGILARRPGYIPAKYLLANLYKARGEFDTAIEYYRQILAARPDYTQAHFTYSGIHKYRDRNDPHIQVMLQLMQADLPEENRTQLAFALSKAYEDVGDYEQAFKCLETGNRLRHQSFSYTIDSDAELIDNIIRTFNRDDLSRVRVQAEMSVRPIFIVGMVRSGTSLVEKILASHPDVYGAGELDYIYSLGTQLFLDPSNHYQFKPLPAYPPARFETLGRVYLAKIGALNDQAGRVVDKMPFNMMMVGLIRLALPNAKIVHCVRDARDTCLSIYRQNFTTGNYRFAYDLKSVGQFHNLYRRLMRHWHEVFPGALYDISYESLTQNPEAEIRKLLSACDLEWRDECLHFDTSPGLVKTASFYQVRQPVYTSSVKLWQKYENYLGPLFAALEEF